MQEECASSLDALVSVLEKCSEDELSTVALECKKSSSGKYGIVIAAGQGGSTSSKRQQVLADLDSVMKAFLRDDFAEGKFRFLISGALAIQDKSLCGNLGQMKDTK